jgi:hypothetical protein
MRIVDDEGKQQPHDGKAVGHLQVCMEDLKVLLPLSSIAAETQLLSLILLLAAAGHAARVQLPPVRVASPCSC